MAAATQATLARGVLPDDGVAAVIGNTPLMGLKRVLPGISFRLFAKLESLNPGGSMKDRPAFHMIRRAIETGAIREKTMVIESSSGNMGIGLAQACKYFGLTFICVVDPKVTEQNRRLLEIYGARVDLVKEPDPVSGEFLAARLKRVQELISSHESAYWPNQYANPDNAGAHHETMREIMAALNGPPDYLFCAASTCGTLRGCVTYLRESKASTKVIAVDAEGSVLFGNGCGKRLIPGHGAAIRPALHDRSLADDSVTLSDLDCVVGCRRLVNTEGILTGGSSGAVMMGVRNRQASIRPGSVCVAIFPDRGERYLDTIYSDQWISENLGEIPSPARDFMENRPCVTTH